MISRYTTPYAREFTDDGLDVGAGYKLFFYAAGTSTQQDTWTDGEGSAFNTNPVIADQDGRFPDIWLCGNYKVILQDADGLQIWSADNVVGSNGPGDVPTIVDTIADLEATASCNGEYPRGVIVRCHTTLGDGGGGYFNILSGEDPGTFTGDGGTVFLLAPGDGSAAAQRHLPTNEVVPEMFGAIGDGVTDDTAALQASGDSGIPARFGAKTYGMTSLYFTHPISWQGGGWNSKIKCLAHNSGNPIIHLDIGSSGSLVRDIELDTNLQKISGIETDELDNGHDIKVRVVNIMFDGVAIGDNIPSGIKLRSNRSSLWIDTEAVVELDHKGSAPRGVTIAGDNNVIEYARNSGDGLGIAVEGTTRGLHVITTDHQDLTDNGFYILVGARDVIVDNHTYFGIEEPFVINDAYNTTVGNLVVGPESRGIALDNAHGLVVNNLTRLDDADLTPTEKNSGSFLYTRSTNEVSEDVTIHNMSGRSYGNLIICNDGAINNLTINNADIVYVYADTVSQSTANPIAIADCNQFSFSNWNLGLEDEVGTLASDRWFKLPEADTVTKQSLLRNIYMWTDSPADYQWNLSNWSKDLIDVVGVMPSELVTAGPYLKSGRPQVPVRKELWGNGAPALGNWGQGDRIYNVDAAASGTAGWICVAGGSPGTWKTFAGIDA